MVELAVEDQRPQRGVAITLRSGDALDDRLKTFFDAEARLAADSDAVGGVQPDNGLNFFEDFIGSNDRQVDLVKNRDDFEIGVDRRVGVGHCLSLHALKSIDEEQRSFARGQTARDLVMEIDVAGRVDQIQLVLLAVQRVVDGDGAGLHGDAAFPLDLKVVENLIAELAQRDRTALQQ